MYRYPWSSSGRKLEGTLLPNQPAAAPKAASRTSAIALFRMRTPHIRTYALVALAKAWLNHLNKALRNPPVVVLGLSSKAASAGLSVRALNAERITEIAMVTANC